MVGRRGGGASVERLRQDGVNLFADFGVVAVARHEHEHGHETVEAVEAQEHAHLGPLAEAQYAHGGREQFVFADLEQLVARKRVEDMRQRLAVMAVGLERRAVRGTCSHLAGAEAECRRACGYRRPT